MAAAATTVLRELADKAEEAAEEAEELTGSEAAAAERAACLALVEEAWS